MFSKHFLVGCLIQCLLFSLVYASETNAQQNRSINDVTVEINMPSGKVSDYFALIESQTQFKFSYDRKDLQKNNTLVRISNASTVAEVLTEISRTARLKFKQVNKNINVTPMEKTQEKEVIVELPMQEVLVSGQVISSEDNTPMPGVNVIIKGTNTGTITDIDGNYKLTVPDANSTLLFSFVGFEAQEVTLGNNTVINVKMDPDSQELDEVMVIAYGTTDKRSFTGSMTQVGAEKIEQRPITNVNSALSGAAPGIQTNTGSGQPGSGPSIRIRGFGSVNASSDPLYVVDGVPFSGNISDLNVGDIENISVLKDASSAALYGSRAANGVVMITTKSGKEGKSQIQVKMSHGVVSRGIDEYETVNAKEYYPMMWEAYRNNLAYRSKDPLSLEDANKQASGLVPGKDGIKDLLGYNPFNVADNAIVGTDGTLNPKAELRYSSDDLDWFDPIERTGSRQNYSVGVNGGTEKSDYFISLGYLDEKGFIKNSDYERINGRLNLNTRPTDWFKTGLNISGALSKSNMTNDESSNGYANPFYFSRNMGPIYPVYAIGADGEYIPDLHGKRQYDIGDMTELGLPLRPSGAFSGRHVIAENAWNKNEIKRNQWSARTYGEVTFLKDFKFRTNISVDISNYERSAFDNSIVGDGAPAGRSRKINTTTTAYTFNQLLSYEKYFGKHHIDVLAGHENYDYTYNYNYGMRQVQAATGNMELINFTTTNGLESYTNKHRIESYLSRANYDYNDKYFLSLSYRRDGSSKFHRDYRWGDFWSVGASWRMDNESFIQSVDWINHLKVRASYGELGNDGLQDEDGDNIYYAWQQLYGLGYNNAYEPGYLLQTLESKNLLWESNATFDVGVDFVLFQDRINGSVEFFHRQSDNLLFRVPVPVSSGFDDKNENVGTMWNRGFEIQLGVGIIRNENFNWDLDLNWTTVENRITKLPQEEIINGTKKLKKGQSIYDYWLRDWYGVDPETGDALYVAETYNAENSKIIDGDTVTTDHNNARYHYSGSAIPDFYGGFTNTFAYKNFTLSVLMTYQVGGKVYDANYASLMHPDDYGRALHKDMLNRWQKPGDITDVPRMDASNGGIYNAQSDRFLTDASFLTLRSVNLMYTLPSQLASKLKVQGANVYLSGENLWIGSKRKGMNVTQSFTGVTSNAYLPARVITLGLNLTI
ncbi:TonB-dependent receptor [Rapidithrix thailandica]|uniref:TonB-dependent receptor n=1 Tax=Rapidithrix thailandica TaxID=413964 RepID=A0AAW9SAG2_9BACT